LACILAALDGSVIEINGGQVRRHRNFRLVATVNGETECFTSKQRNVLPTEMLSRFRTISFSGLTRGECETIFSELVPKSIPQARDIAQAIAGLHAKVQQHFLDPTPDHRDLARAEAIITLRNFSCAMAIMEAGTNNARDACTVAYLAQLPRNERAAVQNQIQRLRQQSSEYSSN
jgi:hypothetical protein